MSPDSTQGPPPNKVKIIDSNGYAKSKSKTNFYLLLDVLLVMFLYLYFVVSLDIAFVNVYYQKKLLLKNNIY